ncbi:MAG: hypothetical protein E5Y61_09105 [Mesorhizobium sp.]|nr:MAG: hypothetical protein E5Y61_09105 [Mesorhizobium sp.]TIM68664.1 MAG: hypothetical protein E5Y60_16405 [Mesorhizobium sp.]
MAGKDCEQFIDDSVCAASVESRVEERSFVAVRGGMRIGGVRLLLKIQIRHRTAAKEPPFSQSFG